MVGVDIGVDVGKRRLALGWPYQERSLVIDLKKVGVRASELYSLSGWMTQVIPEDVRLWIEQPYLSNGPGANQTVTIGMAETVGAVQSAREWKQVTMVGQSTWKAQVCGNGRASKEEVALWLETNEPELYDLCCGDQDRIDAMCIGLYGRLRSTGVIEAPVKAKKRPRKRKAV